MDEDKILEQFIYTMKVGIAGVEQDEKGYRSQNPDSTAAGKYQFLKSWLPNIQKFSKGLYGKIENMEDFKNNPQLQDDFFEFYAKTKLYEQAKTLLKNNPKNFSLDEVGAVIHFQGYPNAKSQISTGTLSGKKTKGENGAKANNMSGIEYLNKFNKTKKEFKLENIDAAQFKTDEQKKSIIERFNKEEAKIDSMDIEQGSKEALRKRLYQNIFDKGNVDIINEHIKKINVANEEKFNSARNLEKVLEGTTRNKFTQSKSISFITDKNADGDLDKAMEDYPDLFKDAMLTKKRVRGGKGSTGKEVEVAYIPQHYAKDFSKKLFDLDHSGEINISHTQTFGNKFYESISDLIPDKLKSGAMADQKTTLESKGKPKTLVVKPEIDPQNLKPKKPRVEPEKEEKVKKEKEDAKEEETPKKDPKNPNRGLAEEYFKTSLALNSLTDDKFNYVPGKKEFNIDVVVGMSLGLIGNAQAKKAKLPLRTEDVSEAMRNFTADLMNKSKEGLPAEIEAAMKNKLADAYQGGLANIVRASAGNRALVLGNLGALEQAKNKGLVGIQVADYEAKDRAFAQYGKAIEYINDFDTRRDIANHGIKYQEAYRKKLQGERLATTGFAKMMEALKYQKENGPGSANDMYRSLLMQKMFGFDPKMKDDGSGSQEGTKSWYDFNKADANSRYETDKGLQERFQNLNPNSKLAFDNLMAQTQDKNVQGKFLDYLENNPNKDLSKTNMENLDLAIKDEDFGLLDVSRKVAINGPQKLIDTNIKAQGIDIGTNDITVPKINTQGLLDALKLGTNKLTPVQTAPLTLAPPPVDPNLPGIPNPFEELLKNN